MRERGTEKKWLTFQVGIPPRKHGFNDASFDDYTKTKHSFGKERSRGYAYSTSSFTVSPEQLRKLGFPSDKKIKNAYLSDKSYVKSRQQKENEEIATQDYFSLDSNNRNKNFGGWGKYWWEHGLRAFKEITQDYLISDHGVHFHHTSKGRHLVINLAFPAKGQDDCYFGHNMSPLMLFFSQKRSEFKNISSFPLIQGSYVYWPEANHPGYFLAYDKDNDKKITSVSEVFGNTVENPSGFEKLKKLDSNKDLVMDSKDKEFKKLYLWKDKNGNGVGEASELISLKDKRVFSISLKYKTRLKFYGKRAQEKEYSHFTYKDKKGNVRKSEIIDIWFSQAPDPRQLASEKKIKNMTIPSKEEERRDESVKRFKAL